MSLVDELAELAAKVEGAREQLNRLSARLGYPWEPTSALRKEQGALLAECLSYRLAMLYKIEEHWPEILSALRAKEPPR